MRTLNRNKRTIYYALQTGSERIFDEYGNDTGEVRKLFGDPRQLKVNVSATIGEEDTAAFGSATNYSRTLCVSDLNCPIDEKSILWFGIEPTEPHNYEVVKVADSLNGLLIAIREVIAGG